MEFSHEELGWINDALNSVLHGPYAIPEWEFHSMVGGEREDVKGLLEKIHDHLGA